MKLLYITSLSGKRINSFMRSTIVAARELGFDTTIACNMNDSDKTLYEQDCKMYGINTVHINFSRNPLKRCNFEAYQQLKVLLEIEKYDIVHCNTPVGGLIGRICAHNMKVPFVVYQAHGFHFYRGAPISNWLLYYPIERFLSKWTDTLITINKEDFELAKNKFTNPKIEYVPGVGISLNDYSDNIGINSKKRKEFDIPENATVVISVGELNRNKNHKVIMSAMSYLNDHVHYVVVGEGPEKNKLVQIASKLHIEKRVHFLGYRTDVKELFSMSNVFVFPSLREGLPSSVMEAMASALPCVVSDIRGNRDLIDDGLGGYLCDVRNAKVYASRITSVINQPSVSDRMGMYNVEKVQQYEYVKIVEKMKMIYQEIKTGDDE